MFKKLSDKNIIAGIKKQDDKILNWLYDNYYQTVKSHIIKNSGTADDVSDVFQDSIIILYNQICEDKLVLSADLKGYFFGIARNIWSNNLRLKKDTDEIQADFPDESYPEDGYDQLLERVVSRAFERISPEYQTILTLFSEGNSYEVIASKLKMKNENYARRKKYLGKEALMEKIKEDPEYQEYLRFRK
ncbi:MAG: sigma-70 family RNA polymerase sigma factor [Bacteroidia bacterium]|nr:sigma-70 family RNA polymerase sigma factor [Bacteroidia bacterium]